MKRGGGGGGKWGQSQNGLFSSALFVCGNVQKSENSRKGSWREKENSEKSEWDREKENWQTEQSADSVFFSHLHIFIANARGIGPKTWWWGEEVAEEERNWREMCYGCQQRSRKDRQRRRGKGWKSADWIWVGEVGGGGHNIKVLIKKMCCQPVEGQWWNKRVEIGRIKNYREKWWEIMGERQKEKWKVIRDNGREISREKER